MLLLICLSNDIKSLSNYNCYLRLKGSLLLVDVTSITMIAKVINIQSCSIFGQLLLRETRFAQFENSNITGFRKLLGADLFSDNYIKNPHLATSLENRYGYHGQM